MDENKLITFFKKKRKDFPILKQKVKGHDLIYFDNGATSQKPQVVIDSLVEYYTKYNSNVHRGIHTLSEEATLKFEAVRGRVAKFISGNEDEIVFTNGTTQSLNFLAGGLSHKVTKGDEIVISRMEHHANIVPWQELCKRTGAKLKYIELTDDGRLDLKSANKVINDKTRIVSIAHVSNVLGTVNQVKDIIKLAKKFGAYSILDGAQAVPHMKINVRDLDCDFYVFSAHKMYGPTGVGVLYGKYSSLEDLEPVNFGGSMIYEVFGEESTYNKIPFKFEAGTPNIADVIAFEKAINYLEETGLDNITKYEGLLTKYFLEKISQVEDLTLYGPKNPKDRAAVFSFNIEGIHSHDMSSILDKFGIAIRAGHHCAMPLMANYNVSATCRASLGLYNTIEEIDKFIEVLKKAKSIYEKGDIF